MNYENWNIWCPSCTKVQTIKVTRIPTKPDDMVRIIKEMGWIFGETFYVCSQKCFEQYERWYFEDFENQF